MPGASARADEDWVIQEFDASILITEDGSINVTEDIGVDFGTLQKHGIFRSIPVEYEYDAKHRRRITITVESVNDGQASPLKYETSREGANLVLKIGDPDKLVSGEQRYAIQYRLQGALNPLADADELYWNVTGNGWPVPIETASATVLAPAFEYFTCYEGPTGSRATCNSRLTRIAAVFEAKAALSQGEGLTIVVGLPKGAVPEPQLDLVEIKSVGEQIRDFVGLEPLPLAVAAFLGIVGMATLGRYWWLTGRDRWFGDVHYLRGGTRQARRPLFARDTVVVEYQPPAQADDRRLRPAEIGVLVDERADTLDVSATIVDLAVRGYVRITELPKEGLFGHKDYRLERLKPSDAALLPYEQRLLDGLFEDGDSVEMSDLKNEFYEDLAKVKEALYEQVVSADRFFPSNPEKVRTLHLLAGFLIAALGVGAGFALGELAGAAIIGVPVLLTGLTLALTARLMPRRTASGREMYRRCLGFREYMEVAETDRQRFAEEAGIFERYLPFAIVFGCTEKWARAFEGIGAAPTTGGWYVSPYAFAPVSFANSLDGFSSSVSSAIASTPGGSGGSGFSGGSSGGGVGGGGGGSW